MVVEDPPEEKVEFEAYQFFVNDEEIQVTYNEKLKAWVIPQLTQYDKFTFKAAVKNTDDTAVYEWTRGMGANRTVIDGATTNEVSVDTSSTNVFTYIIDGKVTCKGQTISLPRIRVSKINAVELPKPEIVQQPVGGDVFVGTESPISVVIKKANEVDLSDVEISGYDKNESGKQTVFLTYKTAACEISIVVIPKSTKITVSVSIYGDSKHGASGGVHGLAMGGLSLWASEPNMEADTTETVWDVLKRVFSKHSISTKS